MLETCVQSLGWEDSLGKGIPTPIFWPGKFHGLYSPCGLKELDTTEQLWASLIAQLVKNPPAKQETPVQLLGWEDPLEKG